MPNFFTYLRLPLLALATSFALTSCFDHDKKNDPRPGAGRCGNHTTPTPAGGAN